MKVGKGQGNSSLAETICKGSSTFGWILYWLNKLRDNWTIRRVCCIVVFLSGTFKYTAGIRFVESIKLWGFFPSLSFCSFNCLFSLSAFGCSPMATAKAGWGCYCKCHCCNSTYVLLSTPTVSEIPPEVLQSFSLHWSQRRWNLESSPAVLVEMSVPSETELAYQPPQNLAAQWNPYLMVEKDYKV